MSTLKLYLLTSTPDGDVDIRTYRDMDAVHEAWLSISSEQVYAVLHCGFMRPKVDDFSQLKDAYMGKVVYTAAMKYALPDYYSSTGQIFHLKMAGQDIPCFLAVDQWGYEVEKGEFEAAVHSEGRSVVQSETCKETIAEAAKAVIAESEARALNKEEVYALIIENGYYQFNTPTPVSVLGVTLERRTLGTSYTKASTNPIFGKTSQNKYYLLEHVGQDPEDWLIPLAKDDPELYQSIHEYGVNSEDTYLKVRDELPTQLRDELDQLRFELLKPSVNLQSPSELINIIPSWLLTRHISDLGFTARVSNVLLQTRVSIVHQIADFTDDQLRKLPNMGRRSIKDICEALIHKVEKSTASSHIDGGLPPDENQQSFVDDDSDLVPLYDKIIRQSLATHLAHSLGDLSEDDRLILHDRLGFSGKVFTLEEVAGKLGITRERVRQRQNKYAQQIIEKEYWDDVIGKRIGELLLDRKEPLILELLDIEDQWFSGFSDNYVYLANVIAMFSENAVQVIEADGRHVVTRIKQKDWDAVVKQSKTKLKEAAKDQQWTQGDVKQYLETALSEYSSSEMMPLLFEVVSDFIQFDGSAEESLLVTYGKSAEAAVDAVLSQAEGPLHYTEIAKRASNILGKNVDDRRAANACSRGGVWQFDRGVYGLIKHCPISESKRHSIKRIVEHHLCKGEINRQWHSKIIIEELKENFPAVPGDFDPYQLRMCIEESEKLIYLNRMIWARADSGMQPGDRIETNESFIQILEEEGKPMSGKALRERLSEIRDVPDSMQIHADEQLVQLGRNMWGLAKWGSISAD
ncbi:hypothetical protein N9284_02030 [Halieaceae bacterium]|nr:hypothetical protein [Halieaceae bacterium]